MSSGESVGKTNSSDDTQDQPQPQAIHDQNSSNLSSTSSISSSVDQPRLGAQSILPYNNTKKPRSDNDLSREPTAPLSTYDTATSSARASQNLSRLSTRYSVREIYGDLPPDDISLRRTATRTTILDTLSHRVRSINQNESAVYPNDEEAARRQSNHVEPIQFDHKEGSTPEPKQGVKEDDEADDGYHDIPDVPVPAKDFGGEFSSIDPELVTWDGPDDPAYPRNWSFKQRCFQTVIVSLYSLISPMSSSILSPAINEISESLGFPHSVFLKSFSVSVMVLAFAIGPLVIAPLSESDRIGRLPVLNFSIWIVGLFNLVCGFAKTTTQLCVFRFLGGLGGCAALNVGAGTLADIWRDDERNAAMAAYSAGPVLGPVLSPVIASFIVTGLNWHWCFWILAIFTFFIAAMGTIFFKETYSPRLLKQKAQRLRKETGNQHLHTIYEIADGETVWGKIYVSVMRPLQFLTGHIMVISLGAFMAFIYGFMYLLVVSFPGVFRGNYGFSTNISGLMYLSMGIGYVLGLFFWAWAIDRTYKAKVAANGGVHKPEYRLVCLIYAGLITPAGLIIYGWGAHFRVHWVVPCLGAAIFAFCQINIFQSIQIYLIQMNNRFAASTVAAAAVYRSCFGFGMPLVAHALYKRLNYGWGNTLCAFLALVLGVPFPVFCLKYGERLRIWSNRRFERAQSKRDERNLQRLKKMNEKEAVGE